MELLQKMKQAVLENGWNLYDAAVMDANGIHTVQFRPANACNDSYSVAKLFTLTALGMLHDAGVLSFHELICDIFADVLPPECDPRWKRVTVEQVILHRFGTGEGYLDIDVEDIRQYGTDDFLQVVFRQPLAYEPGEHYQYSDAAYYLLSRVVSRKTGQKLDDYLRPRLFVPLQFQEVAWSCCPGGYPMGATGLYIRTQDMVKLGWAYLNGGIYGSRRIFSQAFAQLAIQKGYELSRIEKNGIYGKGGMHGQMLLFSQQDHLAVAWHGFDDEGSGKLLRLAASWLNALQK